MEKSLIYCGTTTYRKDTAENQDAWSTFSTDLQNTVIVADGLGSSMNSGLAAKKCSELMTGYLAKLKDFSNPAIQEVFLLTRKKLKELVSGLKAETYIQIDWEKDFSTTLIAAAELADEFLLAFCGNGAAWHIKGNFNHFNKSKYLPWNSLNYLNPHTVQNDEGKESLYKLLSISSDDDESVPEILRFTRDPYFGDILLICTDGIYSFDQTPIGKSKDGSVWISGERLMSLVYEHMDNYFRNSAEYTQANFEAGWDEFLNRIREEKLIEDDATLGIIVSGTAIKYQEKHRQKQQ